MATESELKVLAAKAMDDDGFAAKLAADPASAAAAEGIELTDEQVEAIKANAAEAEAAGDREGKVYLAAAILIG